MFGSFRLRRRAVTVLSLLCVAVIIGVCLLMLRAGAPDAVTIGGEDYSLHAEDAADIEAFLKVCGFVPEGCVSDRTLTVPKTWNEVYTAYNALQRAQGMDLVPYKGKQARELIYASAQSGDFATVLVCRDRIIAAHRGTMLYGDEPRALIDRD